jgi:hypothetical protein
MARVKVCPRVGCPSLMPCETHSRPANASWSKDRNRQQQHKFRTATLTNDGYTCTRCGHHDPSGKTLDAHHVSPTLGTTLCNSKANGCHSARDVSAR